MTIGMLGFGEVAQAIFERIGEHWELSIKRILSPAPRRERASASPTMPTTFSGIPRSTR